LQLLLNVCPGLQRREWQTQESLTSVTLITLMAVKIDEQVGGTTFLAAETLDLPAFKSLANGHLVLSFCEPRFPLFASIIYNIA